MSEAVAQSLFARAEALYDLRRYAESRVLLTHLLGVEPRDYRAHCLLSLNSLKLKEPATALKEAVRAVAIAPDKDWAHRIRAAALLELGGVNDAIAACEEALRANPNEPLVHIQRAQVWLAKGWVRKAEEAAREALRLSPSNTAALNTLGTVLLKRRRYRRAAKVFREALSHSPDSAVAHNDLGVTLMAHARMREAARSFLDALRIAPTLEAPPKNLAVVFVRYRFALLVLTVLSTALLLPARSLHLWWLPVPSLALLGVIARNYVLVRRSVPRSIRRALPPVRKGQVRRGLRWVYLLLLELGIVLALLQQGKG